MLIVQYFWTECSQYVHFSSVFYSPKVETPLLSTVGIDMAITDILPLSEKHTFYNGEPMKISYWILRKKQCFALFLLRWKACKVTDKQNFPTVNIGS